VSDESLVGDAGAKQGSLGRSGRVDRVADAAGARVRRRTPGRIDLVATEPVARSTSGDATPQIFLR
jgi:hypothetical protein